MPPQDPPMSALTEHALESSQLNSNNFDPIKMFAERSDTATAKSRGTSRRASLTGASAQYGGHDTVPDDHSVRSSRSNRNRRASLSGALPGMMGPPVGGGASAAYGYGYSTGSGNDEHEDERSVYSSRSRKSRRASATGAKPPTMLDDEDNEYGYGTDKEDTESIYSVRSKMRRASMSRSSKPARRASAHATAAALDGPPIAHRRGSAGFGAGAASVARMPKRMSNGMPIAPPTALAYQTTTDSFTSNDHSAPARRPARNRDIVDNSDPPNDGRYDTANRAEHPKEEEDNGKADSQFQPLQRQHTADSMDLKVMAQGAAANLIHHPQAGGKSRRGGRRGSEEPAHGRRQVARTSTGDSLDMMVRGKVDEKEEVDEEDEDDDDKVQPLQRNNTGDSLEFMSMAQSAAVARATPHSGGKSRRGGRRDSTEEPQEARGPSKRAPVERSNTGDSLDQKVMGLCDDDEEDDFQPLQRNITGDSMDLMAMAQAATTARATPKAGGKTRRGRPKASVDADDVESKEANDSPVAPTSQDDRPLTPPPAASVGISADSTSTSGDISDLEEEDADDIVDHLAVIEDNTPKSKPARNGVWAGVGANTRRGGRRGADEKAPVPARRGVQRQETGDSLEEMRLSLSDHEGPTEADLATEEVIQPVAPAPKFSGINPDAIARMSNTTNGSAKPSADVSDLESSDDDSEDDDPYGYGPTTHATVYGYANDAASDTESLGSRQSGRSSKSLRRNSTIIRPDTNPFKAPQKDPSSDRQESDAKESTSTSTAYGYGETPRDPGGRPSYDSESDASQSSNRRTRRRNSCLIVAGQGPREVISMLNNSSRMSDRDLAPDVDDFNNPDSLLNRAKYGAPPKVNTVVQVQDPVEATDVKYGAPPQMKSVVEVEDPLEATAVAGIQATTVTRIQPSSVNTGIPAKKEVLKKKDWGRARPFTSPMQLQTLTAEKLAASDMNAIKFGGAVPGNWADVDVSIGDDDTPSDSSDGEIYGPNMYNDSATDRYRDIDEYKQKARRRASLELTCINIEDNVESELQTKKLAKFTPAVGCTSASDFLVRCFTARLRVGITVIKHNRSRWSKSQLRTLYLLPNGKTLSWKPAEDKDGKVANSDKGKRPKLDLARCIEVRHAWSKDPTTKRQTGTAIMRKRCKDGLASRSFALIFNKRTLDMTALTTDQCKLLMEGFTALCFRLHLDSSADEDPQGNDDSRGASADDDWASTIYGASSTVSMSFGSTAGGAGGPSPTTPWGL